MRTFLGSVFGLAAFAAVVIPVAFLDKKPDPAPTEPVRLAPPIAAMELPVLRQPPPVVGNPVAYQLAGRHFLIRCTLAPAGPYTGAVVVGTVNGPLDADPATGTGSSIFRAPQLGPAAIIPVGAGPGVPIPIMLANAPPAIAIGFLPSAGNITFGGSVTDDTAESRVGLMVVLVNAPSSIQGQWTSVRTDGSWSITVPGYGLSGPVTAVVTDWYGATGTATVVLP